MKTFLIIAVIVAIILAALWFMGGKKDTTEAQQ